MWAEVSQQQSGEELAGTSSWGRDRARVLTGCLQAYLFLNQHCPVHPEVWLCELRILPCLD